MVARVTPNDEVERSSRLWVDAFLLSLLFKQLYYYIIARGAEVVGKWLCFGGVTWSLAFWRAGGL